MKPIRKKGYLLVASLIGVLAAFEPCTARPPLKDGSPGSCELWRAALKAKRGQIADPRILETADQVLVRVEGGAVTAEFVAERRTLVLSADGRIEAFKCG